jgi:uncharacterized protein
MSTKRFLAFGAVLTTTLLGCLTVNVYFYPSEEVDKTAKEIIKDIRGATAPEEEGAKQESGVEGARPVNWNLVGIAYAGAKETAVSSPAIDSLKAKLKQRSNTLTPYFDAGAIGEGNDGLVAIRDASVLPMKDRAKLNQVVKEENTDRMALYEEVAKELEVKDKDLPQVQKSFATQWQETARKGWWVQDASGAWRKM